MKQSAVEYLVNTLTKREYISDNDPLKEVIEQAKEMEKQQIIDAYTHDRALLKITAEQYYEQTFNK